LILPKGYSARPAALKDAKAIADLQNAVSLAVIGRRIRGEDQVRSWLRAPGLDLGRDTQIVLASGGTVSGYAGIYDRTPHVRLFASVDVHPSHTGRGIGTALLDWSERRARGSVFLAPPNTQVTICQEVEAVHTAALDLLGTRGYAATRYFSFLQAPLGPLPATPQRPEGIIIRQFQGREELPQLVRADAAAFRDHWGYVEQPFDENLEEWEAWIANSERYDPSQWLLAVDGEEIVGLAIAMGATDEDPKMAYVEDLGVRREWRRRGIGTALLLSLLHVLRELGFERAALDVDADSLTGATRLYERLGFRPVRQSVNMELELRPGRDLRTQSAPS
jgi:mycothiol synthase